MTGVAAPLLALRDVSHEFPVRQGLSRRRRLKAVDGVTLDVRPGEVLAIVGESGCGKTTLARLMLGLYQPTRGDVSLRGQPLASLERRELARRVQLVFQDPFSALNPRRSIGAILMQPLRVAGNLARAEMEHKAREILATVGLPAHAFDQAPSQLSGGQRQRVVIARALIVAPELVVCDEPTSALDVSVQAQILNLLLDLRRDRGLTYVLISHNLAVVRHMATRVGVMYLGRLVELGSTEEVLSAPRHPYTRALLKSVLTPKARGGIPSIGLGGQVPSPLAVPPSCRFHPRCANATALCATAPPPLVEHAGSRVECHHPLR